MGLINHNAVILRVMILKNFKAGKEIQQKNRFKHVLEIFLFAVGLIYTKQLLCSLSFRLNKSLMLYRNLF